MDEILKEILKRLFSKLLQGTLVLFVGLNSVLAYAEPETIDEALAELCTVSECEEIILDEWELNEPQAVSAQTPPVEEPKESK